MMGVVINVNKIPRKIYVSFIKLVGRFNMPWYLKRYVRHLRKYGMDIDGMPQYIAPTATFDGRDYSLIHIGDKTVIAGEVMVLTHDYSIARAREAIGGDMTLEAYFLREISIGKNCFIGARSILMPGCTIGDNCIIGAGSIVRGKIEPNSIIVGGSCEVVGNTLEWARKKQAKGEYYRNASRTH